MPLKRPSTWSLRCSVAPVLRRSGAPALRRSGTPVMNWSAQGYCSVLLLQRSTSPALKRSGAWLVGCLAAPVPSFHRSGPVIGLAHDLVQATPSELGMSGLLPAQSAPLIGLSGARAPSCSSTRYSPTSSYSGAHLLSRSAALTLSTISRPGTQLWH